MVGSDKKLEAEGTHIKIIIQSYWCNWIIPVALSLSRRGKHSYEICPPPHNNVSNHINSYWTLWAWWRQMFGPGMGEHHTNRLSLYLWEKRDIYKRNAGCNWFREFNHFTDLLYMRSHKLSFHQCAAYKYLWNLTSEEQLVHLKEVRNTRSPTRDWNPCHLFIWSKIWFSARGPLGVKICLFLLINHREFPWITPPSAELEWGTGEQTDGKSPMGKHPLGEPQLAMALSCCLSNGDYVTHTHTHLLLKMSWHLALQQVRR